MFNKRSGSHIIARWTRIIYIYIWANSFCKKASRVSSKIYWKSLGCTIHMARERTIYCIVTPKMTPRCR